MDVKTTLRRINFKIGKLDDIAGKAINNLVSNRVIIDELNEQLKDYANKTKGITDIYSFSLNRNEPFIEAPSLALRSEAYYYAIIYSRGTIFPIDMRSPRDVYPIFRYNPQNGITTWLMPWGAGDKQYFSAFPMNNLSANTTVLTADISITDTTIPVASTAGYVNNHGRITIGSEKIMYEYKDTTNFYGCVRGVEQTTAANYLVNSAVTENNVILYYSRLPVPIVMKDDTFIDQSVLDREIEVVDEHMQGIIKAVAYEILAKLDPERATGLKVDTEDLYALYQRDIRKGYWRGRQGANIREPYFNETGAPYFTNLIY